MLHLHGAETMIAPSLRKGTIGRRDATCYQQETPLTRDDIGGVELASKTLPTAEELRSLLDYDPETGALTWKASCRNQVHASSLAGYPNRFGYRDLSIRGRKYKAHRIAWCITTGAWPDKEIDHVNGDRDDNRLVNLRLATRSQNSANVGLGSRNKSGIKGVSFREGRFRPWSAHIQKDGVLIHLGSFATREEAGAAYAQRAKELFGEFANTASVDCLAYEGEGK
jgi:hypothetical protein